MYTHHTYIHTQHDYITASLPCTYIHSLNYPTLDSLAQDFFLDPQSLTPQATEVLKEGTGFLTPDDLMEFDKATDEFLNGEYFKCPSSAAELVNLNYIHAYIHTYVHTYIHTIHIYTHTPTTEIEPVP